MIRKNGKDIIALRKGMYTVNTLHKWYILLWNAVRSCFGSGKWVGEKTWSSEEGWKNIK